MRTIAVCSHDDYGEDELQRSQGIIERFALRHVQGHDVQRGDGAKVIIDCYL